MAVKAALLLHLRDDVLHHLLLVAVQAEARRHGFVAADEPAGDEAGRKAGTLRMVLDQMHEAVEAAVHRSAVVILVAEILAFRFLLILGDMYGMLHKFAHTFAGGSGNRYDRDAEQALHLIDTDGTAVAPQLIHHIERQYHRHIQLHQLHGQVEVAFDIVGINDIDDRLGLLVNDEVA